jgi:hypothetical protein
MHATVWVKTLNLSARSKYSVGACKTVCLCGPAPQLVVVNAHNDYANICLLPRAVTMIRPLGKLLPRTSAKLDLLRLPSCRSFLCALVSRRSMTAAVPNHALVTMHSLDSQTHRRTQNIPPVFRLNGSPAAPPEPPQTKEGHQTQVQIVCPPPVAGTSAVDRFPVYRDAVL